MVAASPLRQWPALVIVLGAFIAGALLAATSLKASGGPGVSARMATASSRAFAPRFDPTNFTGSPIDNAYFPLVQGTTFVYRGIEEKKRSRDVVEVTHRKKTILGVPAVVVRDRLFLDGRLAESTYDWYAQDNAGNVWYLGEDTRELRDGKVASTEGSWEAGQDGARPGIIMEARPNGGDTYRQEFYRDSAEDQAQVLQLDASVSVPYGSFHRVQLTKEWSPLEPRVIDHKYYARGLGLVAERTAEGPAESSQLVSVVRPSR